MYIYIYYITIIPGLMSFQDCTQISTEIKREINKFTR